MDPKFTQKDSFCVAPWLSLHVDAQGYRRVCGISERAPESANALGAQEFRNGEYLRGLRRQMMAGALPADCQACKSPNKIKTYRDELNFLLKDQLESIEKYTQQSGFIRIHAAGQEGLDIKYMDYRDSTCNFSCKTCSVESSSTWLKEIQSQWPVWKRMFSEDFLRFTKGLREQKHKNNEFLEVLQEANPAILYFAGGEPLLSPQHSRALEYLLQSGKSQNMQLFYNTNLSLSAEKLKNWLVQLDSFQRIFLFCSLDGVGERGEYIRSGLNYAHFLENFELLLADKTNREVILDCTVTSLFLFDPISLAELALRFQVQVFAKLMIGMEKTSKFLRCEFLPQELRLQLLRKWQEYYDQRSAAERALLFRLHDAIVLAASKPEFPEQDYPEILKQLNCHEQAFLEEGKFFEFVGQCPEAQYWLGQIQSIKDFDSVDGTGRSTAEQNSGN